MRDTIQKLHVFLLMIVIFCMFLTSCASEITTPITAVTTITLTTTTTTIVQQITTQPNTTTPTITNNTPPTATTPPNTELTSYQVMDLIAPDQVEGVWTFSLIITNTTNSQVSCDVPVKLYRVEDPNNFRTYIIGVTLDKDETKEAISEDIYVPSGSYELEVSGTIKDVEVG